MSTKFDGLEFSPFYEPGDCLPGDAPHSSGLGLGNPFVHKLVDTVNQSMVSCIVYHQLK